MTMVNDERRLLVRVAWWCVWVASSYVDKAGFDWIFLYESSQPIVGRSAPNEMNVKQFTTKTNIWSCHLSTKFATYEFKI